MVVVSCFCLSLSLLIFAPCGRLQPHKPCLRNRNGVFGIQIILVIQYSLINGWWVGGWVGGLVFAGVAAYH